MTEDEITYKIRHAIFDVYNELGPGLLESIYKESLIIQLRKDKLKVSEESSVPVYYRGTLLQKACLRIDILVEDEIIIELKSVEELKKVHFKQLDISKAFKTTLWPTCQFQHRQHHELDTQSLQWL